MAQEAYHDALVAGVLAGSLALPESIAGKQRVIRLSLEQVRHIATRRPDWLLFCLQHLAEVIADPEYIGHRLHIDPRRVELVRRVGASDRLLLVAVKFLDDENEAWVSTAHPMAANDLTRRLRAHTIPAISRGP